MSESNDKETLDELIKSSNNSKYNQSSKLSDICRYWMYALIGIIWSMSYKNHQFIIEDNWILSAFICVIVFHIIDIGHYLSSTIFHHIESFYLDNNKKMSNKEINEVKLMDKRRRRKNSRVSFVLLLCKPLLAIIASILFVIAIS